MQYTENNEAIIDGNRTIPCDEKNMDYVLIEFGRGVEGDEDYIAPTLDQVQAYEPPFIDPQTVINVDALAYLASTDWYVTRFAETGVLIPVEIKNLRQTARTNIL